MRNIAFLMLMGLVAAQNFSFEDERSHPPIPKKEFNLLSHELPIVNGFNATGIIHVEFEVDENGHVNDAVILDTFNTAYNDVVLDKIKDTAYHPARQNGRPVRVRYKLPIKISD
tara:strand:+ start:294 stop:635 length:342 start_codon:yes stop_codon:yes gene_type:complete